MDSILPRIVGRTLLGKGRWLALNALEYLDPRGVIRHWECTTRTTCTGAVAIIAVLSPSRRLVLVRQFRPPVEGFILEFPAGLVDPDESMEETAVRELREETGYHGEIIGIEPFCYSSPGLTGEFVAIVRMRVDETTPENRRPIATPEESEEIETVLVPIDDLADFLRNETERGCKLDAKVAGFSIGINFGKENR
jgi:ADP-ribose pyrophosphatase